MMGRYLLVLASVCAISGCSSDDGGPAKSHVQPLDPAGVHFGKSYGEWGGAWWKWIYEIDQSNGCVLPINDPTGASCGAGQDSSSEVFFIPGNNGDVSVRDQCVVPAGKALFFPILNATSDNVGEPFPYSDEELKQRLLGFKDLIPVETLLVQVDAYDVPSLAAYWADPTAFEYTIPAEPNFFSCTGVAGIEGTFPSYSAGYWMLLPPLESGQHKLRFGGRIEAEPQRFELDVTYLLRVE